MKSKFANFSHQQIEQYVAALEKQNDARNSERLVLYKQIDVYKSEIDNLHRKIQAMEKQSGAHGKNFQMFKKENDQLHQQIQNVVWQLKQREQLVEKLQAKIKQLIGHYQSIPSQIFSLFHPYLPNSQIQQHDSNTSASVYSMQPLQLENQLKLAVVKNLQTLVAKIQRETEEKLMQQCKYRQMNSFMQMLANNIGTFWNLIDDYQEMITESKKLQQQNHNLKQQLTKILELSLAGEPAPPKNMTYLQSLNRLLNFDKEMETS